MMIRILMNLMICQRLMSLQVELRVWMTLLHQTQTSQQHILSKKPILGQTNLNPCYPPSILGPRSVGCQDQTQKEQPQHLVQVQHLVQHQPSHAVHHAAVSVDML